MVTPYFSDIRKTLAKAISEAATSIDIAVAWFTNEELFNAVLEKLDAELQVRLVLINDDINHCGGLDFQKFIDKGGQLYFGKNGYFMHNKYCIIDGNAVYTGSYNYTYFAEHSNFENIVCISDEKDAVEKYVENYEMILRLSDRAADIKSFLAEHPYTINSHASRSIISKDAFQKANELLDEGNPVLAEQVMEGIVPQEELPDTFVIRDVLFKQWQPRYCVERIEVTKTKVIVDINVDAVTESCYIYGPGLDKTWHFLLPDGTPVYASSVTNVRYNDGTILSESIPFNKMIDSRKANATTFLKNCDRGRCLDSNELCEAISHLKKEGQDSLLCRLTFPRGGYINGPVDLMEGNDNDKEDSSYWHFLRIDMRFNREAVNA
ncbi:MAG: hypothetical protein J5886_04445 [Bacteroidales bacterium]|nr:hypothetical protein [Bacteroidales bacterium]